MMKVILRVKNEKEVMQKLERANELLKELMDIFQGYDGLGRGIEVEVMPASDEDAKDKLTKSFGNKGSGGGKTFF